MKDKIEKTESAIIKQGLVVPTEYKHAEKVSNRIRNHINRLKNTFSKEASISSYSFIVGETCSGIEKEIEELENIFGNKKDIDWRLR